MTYIKYSIDDTFDYPYSLRSASYDRDRQGIIGFSGYCTLLNMKTIDLEYHTVICFEI